MTSTRDASAERRQLARAALDDTPALLTLYRLVHAVDSTAPPTAHVISTRQPLSEKSRVGLFAGSFNPLTRAHLAIAEAARRDAALDALVWAIAAVTVDKERVQRASVPDRLAQMNALLRTTPSDGLVAFNRGLYVEEAEALRRELASSAALYILVGFDKIVQIFDPRYYDDRDAALRELFELAHVLVAPRDDAGAEALASLLTRPENQQFAEFVQFVPVPPEHARDSSTEARALAGAAPLPLRTLSRLLPPEGMALAQTGAYTLSDAGTASDRYTLRERWLHALDVMSVPSTASLPPLSRLVARAARPSRVGAHLRTWLADPSLETIPPEARRILAL